MLITAFDLSELTAEIHLRGSHISKFYHRFSFKPNQKCKSVFLALLFLLKSVKHSAYFLLKSVISAASIIWSLQNRFSSKTRYFSKIRLQIVKFYDKMVKTPERT